MQFSEFVRELDSAVRTLGPVQSYDDSEVGKVSWTAGERHVDVALVEPRNVSVALGSVGRPDVTTWYPVDANLVPVVSRRIAGFLSES
jgi:hypothetical protein